MSQRFTREGESAGRRALVLLPHVLTASRVLSAPALFWTAWAGDHAAATALLAVAIATDFADGQLARRFGKPSRMGALFDVWADFLIIVAVFGGLAAGGVLTAWPLLPILASFALFLLTARRRAVLYDPVGRYIGGILMVVALCLLIVPDFVVQETLAVTAAICCIVTMTARLAIVATELVRVRGTWARGSPGR